MPLISKRKPKASQIIGKIGELISEDTTQQIITETTSVVNNTKDSVDSIKRIGANESIHNQANDNCD